MCEIWVKQEIQSVRHRRAFRLSWFALSDVVGEERNCCWLSRNYLSVYLSDYIWYSSHVIVGLLDDLLEGLVNSPDTSLTGNHVSYWVLICAKVFENSVRIFLVGIPEGYDCRSGLIPKLHVGASVNG